jgi:protein SCO1
MRKYIYIVFFTIAFFATAAGVFLTSDYFARKWESERILKATLKDSDGNPWQISQLKNKIGIVYFGYTSCPDACPTALNDLAIALDTMGENRRNFQPIFISVDPERDTPEVIKEYVAHFDKAILGLTSSASDLKAFSFNFGATYSLQKKDRDDKDYIVNHTAGFFMVTATGDKLSLPLRDNPEELQKTILKLRKRILGLPVVHPHE